MNILLYCLIVCSGALVSCSLDFFDHIADPYNVVYVERVIVQGILIPGRAVDSIVFQRTLPLTDTYSPTQAAIDDVTAVIKSDDSTYTLQSIGNGKYLVPGLIPQSGKRYTLEAIWHDKKISSTTLVPYPTTIDTAWLTKTTDEERRSIYETDVRFPPKEDEVFTVELLVKIDSIDSIRVPVRRNLLTGRSYVIQRSDAGSDGLIHFFGSVRSRRQGGTEADTLNFQKATVIVSAFDHPYYDFSTTFYNGNQANVIFPNNGSSIKWNIIGDGIGFFFGRAETQIRLK